MPVMDRGAIWASLNEPAESDETYDMIIIGGGITGAGILREAARRGYRAVLVEQQDFAYGTSSRSSKMVHGGLRYLASGDFKLTHHSLVERERLVAEAPGLVTRMGYYFLVDHASWLMRLGLKPLMWLYDKMAGIRDHHRVQLSDLTDKFPGINVSDIASSYYYSDTITDDTRLVLRVLEEALSDKCKALNYARVTDLMINDGKVVGVKLTDLIGEKEINLKAKLVINATGAWADRLRRKVRDETRVRPLRGSHIALPATKLPAVGAITLSHPTDGRKMFIYPWMGAAIVGTTDLDHPGDMDIEASISRRELDYLLVATNALFPQSNIDETDVISTWSGVRPIITAEPILGKIKRRPSSERRDHAVWLDSGMITVSGGKLTTFRLIALDVMARAEGLLPAAHAFSDDRIFADVALSGSDILPKDPAFGDLLIGRYGAAAMAVIKAAKAGELSQIYATPFCLADVRRALTHEAVVHLDDLMLRRTRLGLLLAQGGESVLGDVKKIAQGMGYWTGDAWDAEVARYQQIWAAHYSLPQ